MCLARIVYNELTCCSGELCGVATLLPGSRRWICIKSVRDAAADAGTSASLRRKGGAAAGRYRTLRGGRVVHVRLAPAAGIDARSLRAAALLPPVRPDPPASHSARVPADQQCSKPHSTLHFYDQPIAIQQVRVQPRSSAVNAALPAFAAEHRAVAPYGLCQSYSSTHAGTDRRTDGQTDGHHTVT